LSSLGLVKKLGFVLAPARTRLARKQNAGLLVGSPTCLPASRVLLTPPAEAAASQKWKIIYLQVLSPELVQKWVGQVKFHTSFCASTYIQTESFPPG